MDFSDKKVLITGASRGIGYATAEEFLALGARVAVNGRTKESVDKAIAELGGGDRLIVASGDVGTVDGCESLVATAIQGLGGLDVLVNNAGIGVDARIEDTDEAFWDATLDTNLKGTFFCSRAALEALRATRGNIVNISSDAGLVGSQTLVAYCASKGGVVNMTRAMAVELAPLVRVNCVCPGYVDTDMVRRDGIDKADDPAAEEQALIDFAPLKRIATPEEIAAVILFLASHEARFMTGAALPIDGGAGAGH
ncbi:MAG: SDR family oxidoreductase [Gemmatimonadetes bacterium]|nr:SDR family oxidoreductase [Gemmatimonadota bacterium]